MRPKTVIGIILLVGFGSLLFMSFGDKVGGYMDFAEATETGSNAHVVGVWVKDNHFTYDRDANVFSFEMKDDSGVVRTVVYNDPKPPNFEDAEQVVVEGKMNGSEFQAESILVKCPSKYNDEATFEETAASP